jgi:hypothetical protein
MQEVHLLNHATWEITAQLQHSGSLPESDHVVAYEEIEEGQQQVTTGQQDPQLPSKGPKSGTGDHH